LSAHSSSAVIFQVAPGVSEALGSASRSTGGLEKRESNTESGYIA
jgi:hypothetical protein